MRNSDDEFNDVTPADRELEGAMRGLAPAAVTISRDRLMFQAGEATGRRTANRWRNAAAALVIVNVGLLSVSLSTRRDLGSSELAKAPVTVAETQPERSAPSEWAMHADVKPRKPAVSLTGYFSLREDVLTRGLSALPADRPIRVEPLMDGSRQSAPEQPQPASPLNSLRTFLFSGENL